jgi:hypothetical protein
MEKTPVGEPVPVDIPNEITLAQLATGYIVPSGHDRLDANTVFFSNLEIAPCSGKKDKTKREVVQIPQKIPVPFNMRAMANTLHERSDGRRVVQCAFGAARVNFTLKEDETVGKLSAVVANWMRQRRQGAEWFVEGNPREVIDFEFCYQIGPIPREEEITIFLKQRKMQVKGSESWMNLSDKLVQQFLSSRGATFRIFPVDMDIQKLGDDDHAYSFDWVEGKQYWFDIVHDHARDKHDLCREIRMVDYGG